MLHLRWLPVFLATLLVGAGWPHGAVADQGLHAQPAKKAASDKKPARPARPPAVAPGGSGETASERSARLRRECKGRPNAGACTGYTD